MGCVLTAVIASFQGVLNNAYESTAIATTYFGLCGQLAALQSKYPGTFRTAFIDTLYKTDLTKFKNLIDKREDNHEI
jgi:hydroxyethylthiazole kinase